jgi:hypothetical protein
VRVFVCVCVCVWGGAFELLSCRVMNPFIDEGALFIVYVKHIYSEVDFKNNLVYMDRLCGLVVRVPGCRPRGPEYDSRRYQIF